MTTWEMLVICLACLVVFLSGCHPGLSAREQVQLTDMEDSLKNHEQDYHPHPFWEQSVSRPVFGERPDKRYGGPPEIPDLPDAIDDIEPVTLTVATHIRHGDQLRTVTRKVTRTANCMHIENPAAEQQWLFMQNPVDRRRVFAQLVDSHERAILEYHESDLADAGLGHGWADIFGLGMPASLIADFQPTEQTTETFGIVFRRYVPNSAPDSTDKNQPREIWWSDKYYLPLRVVDRDGVLRQEITSIDESIDPTFLGDARKRYIAYAVVDKADWKSCDTNHYGLPRVASEHGHEHAH